jgi:2-keto-4-pentenoate hydratase/2-oxohepta-3-ene-1,7-dioic acid hydratase in catechol pathway
LTKFQQSSHITHVTNFCLALASLGTVAISDLDEALTFARIGAEHPAVIAVRRWDGGTVEAVDLSQALGRPVGDPISLFLDEGYDGLRDRIAAAPESARRLVPATALVRPVDLGAHHVAVGTNYPAHAGEADVDGGPFLFPKLVEPTASRAEVPAGRALLDYEVEVAFVLLEDLAPGETPASVGLILANDLTDRETLLRHVDPWNPTSGRGFTTGKSFPGFLPVGALFVVPRDPRAFVRELELRLCVNDDPRQQARVGDALWDLDRILAETWARRDVTWDHRGQKVSLLDAGGHLPARSLIVSGTPGGTVFRGVSSRTKLAGVWRWIRSGFALPLTTSVIDAYIDEARAAGTYLQPGDRVAIHVDRLGVLESQITD